MTDKTAPSKKEKAKFSYWHPAILFCTCSSVGRIPFAPGTWGSLAGVLIAAIFSSYYEWMVISILFFFLGWLCSNIFEKKSGIHDSKEIVIDEVVGQILAFLVFGLVVDNMLPAAINQENILYAPIILFITFRAFDIVKRGPVGWVDKNVKGGLGVMLDDVVAGVLAGVTSALIFLVI